MEKLVDRLVKKVPDLEPSRLSLLDVLRGGHSAIGKSLIYNLMISYEVKIDYESCDCYIADELSCEYGDGVLVSCDYLGESNIPYAIVMCILGS